MSKINSFEGMEQLEVNNDYIINGRPILIVQNSVGNTVNIMVKNENNEYEIERIII